MRFERLVLHKVGPFQDLDLTFREGSKEGQAEVHLLVGPNGSGKSTILYALAELSVGFGGTTPVAQREHSRHSVLWAKRDGRWNGLMHSRGPDDLPRPPHEDPDGLPASEWTFLPRAAVAGEHPLETAEFAYTGYRTTSVKPLKAISEPEEPSPASALSFDSPDANLMKNWVASQMAKAAFAMARNDFEKAAQRRATLALVERMLSRVMKTDVRFELQEDPIEVLMRLGERALDLNVIPGGLKSILSWVGDLLMRLELAGGADGKPVNERAFRLFLDEIEVHLHPEWQRHVVPALQGLFPNAQVFIATHSPFVVASADNAWIYPLTLNDAGEAQAGEPLPSQRGRSYAEVLQDVFGIESDFDPDTERELKDFLELRDRRLKGDESVADELQAAAVVLGQRSTLLSTIVGRELRALERALQR